MATATSATRRSRSRTTPQHGERGAWEIDHSVPQANGGTDHGNNLVPACTSCNRSKQDTSTRAIRMRNGVVQRPPSREQRREAAENAAIWKGLGAFGLAAGAALALVKLFGKNEPTPGGDPSL